jgi:hypothetical protein
LSNSEDVIDIAGDFTGGVTGRGASHEPRDRKNS